MKTLGVILLIVAAFCGLGAILQTRETEMETLNNRVISSAEEGLKTSQAMNDYIETSARLQGVEQPSQNTRAQDGMRDSLINAQSEAKKYRAERNQRMLLCIGGAAVSFLAGIICFSARRKSEISAIMPGQNSPVRDSTVAMGQDIETRLADLKSLLEKELISQTDYESKKKQVIGEL
jgi:hypothetical protein